MAAVYPSLYMGRPKQENPSLEIQHQDPDYSLTLKEIQDFFAQRKSNGPLLVLLHNMMVAGKLVSFEFETSPHSVTHISGLLPDNTPFDLSLSTQSPKRSRGVLTLLLALKRLRCRIGARFSGT